MTKLIFMGTPDFSATVLKGLLADSRYEILAGGCDSTRPQSRSQKRDSNDPGEAGSFGTSTTGSSAGEIIG